MNPGYTHLLGYGSPRGCRLVPPIGPGARALPDVLPTRGTTDWTRGTGIDAATAAVRAHGDKS